MKLYTCTHHCNIYAVIHHIVQVLFENFLQGDLWRWVGVRRRPSSIIRSALTSSSPFKSCDENALFFFKSSSLLPGVN